MIVLDTSALVAILTDEPMAGPCQTAILSASALCISAGTLSEALIVAEKKNALANLQELLTGLEVEVFEVTALGAQHVAEAYYTWGKGVHPAKLNFGDCFAYALAKELNCPLLFVGNDFALTTDF
jgi:ribonuclease VapC